MIVEDAHWIDPTSLDLTGRLLELMRPLPILLVMTFRPELSAPWIGRDHVAVIPLNRLERDQAAKMIDRMTSGRKLPADVLDQIVEKTDGIPLFVEELTKSVLESGLVREENGAYVLDTALTSLAIPLDLARLIDGAAGSPVADQGDRPDRGGDRTRVLPGAARSGIADQGRGAWTRRCAS